GTIEDYRGSDNPRRARAGRASFQLHTRRLPSAGVVEGACDVTAGADREGGADGRNARVRRAGHDQPDVVDAGAALDEGRLRRGGEVVVQFAEPAQLGLRLAEACPQILPHIALGPSLA